MLLAPTFWMSRGSHSGFEQIVLENKARTQSRARQGAFQDPPEARMAFDGGMGMRPKVTLQSAPKDHKVLGILDVAKLE
jgi:hypothetical protein